MRCGLKTPPFLFLSHLHQMQCASSKQMQRTRFMARRHPKMVGFQSLTIMAICFVACANAVSQVLSHQSQPLQKCDFAKVATNRPVQTVPEKVFHETNHSHLDFGKVPCLFRIKVPHTKPGDTVKIVGSADSIGNWKPDKALTLKTSEIDFPW